MITSKGKLIPIAKLYDKVRVREYVQEREGLIFGYEFVVQQEKIGSELILKIQSEIPDKIIFNGKEVKLIPNEK